MVLRKVGHLDAVCRIFLMEMLDSQVKLAGLDIQDLLHPL